ncbi:MAG: PEP-CTERM sorting domain-containing protein [Pirellulales bacterium]
MKNILFALLIVLSSSLSAIAGAPVSEVVLVETGVFDNPGLAGFSTYAIRVTADTDWTNADLNVSLVSGTLNHVAPAFLGSPNGVNGFGDTAGMAPTTVNGDITGGFNGVAGFAGDHTETPTTILSSWFTTETDDIGTFDIAMITISNDANGSLNWRTIAGNDVENRGFGGTGEGLPIINGAIGIPEPTSIALVGLGLIGLWGTRRRRSL